MLSLVTGVCSKASATSLAKITSESPVDYKVGRLCTRLARYTPRDGYQLLVGDQTASTTSRSNLRSGTTNHFRRWAGVCKHDLGDLMHMHKANHLTRGDLDLYDKRKKVALVFDEQIVRRWVKKKNREIATKAKFRFLGLLD